MKFYIQPMARCSLSGYSMSSWIELRVRGHETRSSLVGGSGVLPHSVPRSGWFGFNRKHLAPLKRVSLEVLFACYVLILLAACNQRDAPVASFGPGDTTDLVVLLMEGVDQRWNDAFVESALVTGRVSYFFQARPGVEGLFAVSVLGHNGYGVMFFPYATREERAAIENAVRSSPFVWRVYKDVIPNRIRP